MNKIVLALLLLIATVVNSWADSPGQAVSMSGSQRMFQADNNTSIVGSRFIASPSNGDFLISFNTCQWYRWDGVRYPVGSINEKLYVFDKSNSKIQGNGKVDFSLSIGREDDSSSNSVSCTIGNATATYDTDLGLDWHLFCCDRGVSAVRLVIDGAAVATAPYPADTTNRYTITSFPLVFGVANSDINNQSVMSGGDWDDFYFYQPAAYPNEFYNQGNGIPIRDVSIDGQFSHLAYGWPLDDSYYMASTQENLKIWSIPFQEFSAGDSSISRYPVTKDTAHRLGIAFKSFSVPFSSPTLVGGKVGIGYPTICLADGQQKEISSTDCSPSSPSVLSKTIPANGIVESSFRPWSLSSCKYVNKAFNVVTGGILNPLINTQNELTPYIECSLVFGDTIELYAPFSYPASTDGLFWGQVEYADEYATSDVIGFNFSAKVIGDEDNTDLFVEGPIAEYTDTTSTGKDNFKISRPSGTFYSLTANNSTPCYPALCSNNEMWIKVQIVDMRTEGEPVTIRIKNIALYWLNMLN